jgi:hypothetical protein
VARQPRPDIGEDLVGFEIIVRFVVTAHVKAQLDVRRATGLGRGHEGNAALRSRDAVRVALQDQQRQAPLAGMGARPRPGRGASRSWRVR